MSKIQSRLNELQPYVIGVRFQGGMSIVDAVFKDGWHVPKSEVITNEKGESDELNYHMFFSQEESIGLDEILDYIEKIIGLNVEREKKHELLKIKAKELTDLFRNNPLSKLQGMKFVLGGDKLVQEMKPDPLDVVDFNIAEPTPEPVTKSEPVPEPVIESVPVPDNVRRAPNGEIIPPISKEDTGEIEEDFEKFELPSGEEVTITKNVRGKDIDLPKKSKKRKVKLAEIPEPTNVICKCTGPDEVCPACEEEKLGVI